MHREAKLLLKFLDGSDNRYIIPVYQRNYDWKPKQCEQLFNDLVQIIKKDRKTHFFGSIITSSANKGGKSDYLVIDGQQRITTISILFTAMVNLMKSGIVVAKDNRLAEKMKRNSWLMNIRQKNENYVLSLLKMTVFLLINLLQMIQQNLLKIQISLRTIIILKVELRKMKFQ